MTDALRHRGPDDGGVWQDPDAGIGLGHRRLAIVDLSAAGHQPMQSHDGRYVLSYNGEIYNHLALRESLGREGLQVSWRGHSDTETLLECFSRWGILKTLKATVGMFAIALWDRETRTLSLARDRFGEKPLYYGWSQGTFLFASELAAIRRAPGFDRPVDADVVALFLEFGYVPTPYAILKDTYKLEPGTCLTMDLAATSRAPGIAPSVDETSESCRIERFWSLTEVASQGVASPFSDDEAAVSALEETLGMAVRGQLMSDVPLGAFLSGGVDSSTIVALTQAQSPRPVRTFTIGFEEQGFDEAVHARAVAAHLGTDHTELYATNEVARTVVPRLPQIYGEPFADASQIPTVLVSEMTRAHVTVALSGDGGDELFGGYNRYLWGRRIWSRVDWMPSVLRRLVGTGIAAVPIDAWDSLAFALPARTAPANLGAKAHRLGHRLRTVRSSDDLYRSLVTDWERSEDVARSPRRLMAPVDDLRRYDAMIEPEHRMMLRDSQSYLPDDILHKVDRAAMSVGLETRVPFLDHRVAALAWRMPLSMKIRGDQGKWILRQLLYRHVPRALIDRPKAGFGVPIGVWLRGPLNAWAQELLASRVLEASGFLNSGPIRRCWSQHCAGTHDWSNRLWSVLMLQAWLAESPA